MLEADPWRSFFLGRGSLDTLALPPKAVQSPPEICDEDLAKAVSLATLAVCEQPPSSSGSQFLPEDRSDPAREMLRIIMARGILPDSEWDISSVASIATSASEVPNDMFEMQRRRC